MDSEPSQEDFWLFGYGSLIWKPPPHFDKRLPGYIEGYVRRFWQARWVSLIQMHLDFIFTRTWNIEWYAARIIVAHQKLQGASSRSSSIVTGQKSQIMSKYTASPKVWGAAYHIPASKAAEVREYLDIREINGYSM
ncbi:hypothetical protein B0A49_05892, partial [Cryomyces minteri]